MGSKKDGILVGRPGTCLPSYDGLSLGSRAPPLARSVHWDSPRLPRRVTACRLRLGHFRSLHDSGSPGSKPRAGTNPRPLGHARSPGFANPRTPLDLCVDASGRTSLVQSRVPNLRHRRAGLPRESFPGPRPIYPSDYLLPGPPHGTLRRVPPSWWTSRRNVRFPLPRAIFRATRMLGRSGHACRAPNQGAQERTPSHASHARHVRPSARHWERAGRQLARTPRRSLIGERIRLRDQVRSDSPGQSPEPRVSYPEVLGTPPGGQPRLATSPRRLLVGFQAVDARIGGSGRDGPWAFVIPSMPQYPERGGAPENPRGQRSPVQTILDPL